MLLHFINQSKAQNIIFIISILIAMIPFTAIIKYISFYVNLIFLLLIAVSIFLHIKIFFTSMAPQFSVNWLYFYAVFKLLLRGYPFIIHRSSHSDSCNKISW